MTTKKSETSIGLKSLLRKTALKDEGLSSAPILQNKPRMKMWGHMVAQNGKRSGDDIAQRVQEAFDDADLSPEEYIVIIEVWKTYPWGSRQEIMDRWTDNVKQRDVKFKVVDGFNFDNSIPSTNAIKFRDLFIPISEKVRRCIKNTSELKWGSVARVDVIVDFARDASDDLELALPTIRKLVMKKAAYNLVAFERTSAMVEMRMIAGLRALAHYQKRAELKKAGEIVNGKKLTTNCWVFPQVKVGEIPQDARINIDDALELIAVYKLGEIAADVQIANFPDVRLLLQCPELRQHKDDGVLYQTLGSKIASLMATMIRSAGGKEGHPMVLEKDSAFSQEYYRCHAFLKGCLRNLTRALFGQTGGPNTRTIQNVSVKAAPIDLGFGALVAGNK